MATFHNVPAGLPLTKAIDNTWPPSVQGPVPRADTIAAMFEAIAALEARVKALES